MGSNLPLLVWAQDKTFCHSDIQIGLQELLVLKISTEWKKYQMKTNAAGRCSKPRSSVPNELSIFCLPTIMEIISGTLTSIYCKILHKMLNTEIGYGVWNCLIESRGISFYDYSTPHQSAFGIWQGIWQYDLDQHCKLYQSLFTWV